MCCRPMLTQLSWVALFKDCAPLMHHYFFMIVWDDFGKSPEGRLLVQQQQQQQMENILMKAPGLNRVGLRDENTPRIFPPFFNCRELFFCSINI